MSCLQCLVKYSQVYREKMLQNNKFKRAKRVYDEEVEPAVLNDFKLLGAYCATLRGQPFTKDITHENDRILILTTFKDLKWVQETKYWVINETIETVPTLFRQLYSIGLMQKYPPIF